MAIEENQMIKIIAASNGYIFYLQEWDYQRDTWVELKSSVFIDEEDVVQEVRKLLSKLKPIK